MKTRIHTVGHRHYVVCADAPAVLDPRDDRDAFAAAYVAGPFLKRSRARRQVMLAGIIAGRDESAVDAEPRP